MRIDAYRTTNYNFYNINNTGIKRDNTKGYNSSNVIFSANFQRSITKAEKLKIAEDALKHLREHFESNKLLDNADTLWLSRLRKAFGTDKMTVNNPNNPKQIIDIDCKLTFEKINNGGIEPLIDALKTMLAATKYKPAKIKLDNTEYIVHNKTIAGLLRSEYDEKHLTKIRQYLNNNHVFDMSDNTSYGLVIDSQRGIAKTCGASENWEMSDRAWITDIVRVGDIQKKKRPETWTRVLDTISDYYKTQSTNIKNLINNPELYREGSPIEGIPHIFMPKTLEPDLNWFNNKRYLMGWH